MQHVYRYLPLLIISGLFLTSCATTQSISDEVRTEVFNSEYDQTFKAVVQTLSDDGYAINSADSETGIINTDYSNASTLEAFFTGDRRTKVNAILSESDAGTEIRLAVSVQKKGTFTGWQSATMTKANARDYYEELFNRISREISSLSNKKVWA